MRGDWNAWRWQLAEGARIAAALPMAVTQPVRVTPYYLRLCNLDDPADPLLRQWLPDPRERGAARSACDPFDEAGRQPAPGVVHRFPDRVLVLVSRTCAVNCRHCTRRNTLSRLPCAVGPAGRRAVAAYIRAHPAVREAILSGGDPLLLPDREVLAWVEAFAALPQLDAVRVGTRVPAVLPMRVTPALARGLGRSRRVWVNTQFNHPRELTPEAAAACARLVDAGIPVSNQAVLLRGVNDDLETLAALCAGLQRLRVRPYYVFQCDPVAGTGHWRVPTARARALSRALARRLGGLAVPRFVVDRPGAPAKCAV